MNKGNENEEIVYPPLMEGKKEMDSEVPLLDHVSEEENKMNSNETSFLEDESKYFKKKAVEFEHLYKEKPLLLIIVGGSVILVAAVCPPLIFIAGSVAVVGGVIGWIKKRKRDKKYVSA